MTTITKERIELFIQFSGGGTVSEISYQASITAGIRIKGEEHGNKTRG
ncbi:hypothetical protein KID55_23090 [Escherichia coli]|nr:hypothetical protein [Escherichia coli]MCQ0450717.1 hypothetical protein [Escherichia coli]